MNNKKFDPAANYAWRKTNGYLPWQMTLKEYADFLDKDLKPLAERYPNNRLGSLGISALEADRMSLRSTSLSNHQREVDRAIECGMDVRPEVVADYPELQKKYSQQYPQSDGHDRTRAASGGEIGVNGYHYKGGQFLPSTTAEPGKWKVGKKWVTAGNELIGPGVWGAQPTPFSRSIFSMIHGWAIYQNDRLELRPNIRDYGNTPITLETEMRPGVKGVMGKEAFTLRELFDAFNNGYRWLDVQPDAEVITTQQAESSARRLTNKSDVARALVASGMAGRNLNELRQVAQSEPEHEHELA